jgi:hypothetical protein
MTNILNYKKLILAGDKNDIILDDAPLLMNGSRKCGTCTP